MIDDPRPQLPEKPAPDECCGGGCAPCVLETYEEQRTRYHRDMAQWLERHPPGPQQPEAAAARTRLVLDTNVSLDLIVFNDPRGSFLLQMLRNGDCDAVMRADCRAEFLRVLGYPQFELSPLRRLRAIQAFDALHRFLPKAELTAGDDVELPRCADPDDQKFLELALQSRADALLSKDKAVLKLARRNRRAGLFVIATPQDWLSKYTPP